jgi:hypothetical protein
MFASRRLATLADQAGRWKHQSVNWSSWAPAVFSLLGVAVGTAGSLLGVYLSTRTAKEQAEAQQVAALRLERKEIILEYLKEMQDMQAFIRSLWHHRETLTTDKELAREASIRSHQMWFYQRKVHLVASKQLREACLAFTEKLDACLGFTDDPEGQIPDGTNFWLFIDAEQDRFLDTARDELGFSKLSNP